MRNPIPVSEISHRYTGHSLPFSMIIRALPQVDSRGYLRWLSVQSVDMPQTQRIVFFLISETIATIFFLPHRGQVIRILPSLSLIHISEPTRRTPISYAVF